MEKNNFLTNNQPSNENSEGSTTTEKSSSSSYLEDNKTKAKIKYKAFSYQDLSKDLDVGDNSRYGMLNDSNGKDLDPIAIKNNSGIDSNKQVGKMKMFFQVVTPELAKRWLRRNHPNNRFIKERSILKYRMIIRKDQWQKNPQSVSFDEKGRLIDGQHRLEAIASENKSIMLVVVTGVPEQAFASIDDTSRRTTADALKISGKYSFSKYTVSGIIAAIRGFKYSAVTPNTYDVEKFLGKYEDSALFVEMYFSKQVKRVNTPAVKAVMMRAFYHFHINDMIDIANALTNGQISEKDKKGSRSIQPIIVLRNILTGKNLSQKEAYSKTQYAFDKFRKNIEIEQLRDAHIEDDIFQLP